MSGVLYVAELTVYDPSLPGTRTLRVSTDAFTTGPLETPANTYYDPRIQQVPVLRRAIFGKGTTRGRGDLSVGELILGNLDRELDGWRDYGFDGRQCVIRRGAPGAAYPAGFVTVGTVTMEMPEFDSTTFTIRLRPRSFELDKPLQPTKYAGTNALPAGLEGVGDDLQGKPKPVLYGTASNFAPPCVNTTRLIYQMADGAVTDVTVFDRGINLSPGADYADQTDMETNAPTAGQVRVWPAGGYFRLGSSPNGLVTCEASEGATEADRTAAQIAIRLLEDRAGLTSSDYSTSDMTALDAYQISGNPLPLGVWVAEETTIAAVLDQVAASVGAWWGVDRSGVFRICQLTDPTIQIPAFAFTAEDIIGDLVRVPSQDEDRGIPVFRCVVRHSRIYSVQTTDLAAGVTDVRRGVVGKEWREAVATNAAVQTKHLLAPQTTEDTLIARNGPVLDGARLAAEQEAARRQVLRGSRRDEFELSVEANATNQTVDIGAYASITHGRYGLAAGKVFLVKAVEPDPRRERLQLTVWG